MANQLKMAKVHTILTLLQQGWSHRRIARELGIDRETVSRYAHQQPGSKPAKAPPGFKGRQSPKHAQATLGSNSKPAKAPPGSSPAGSKPASAPPGSECAYPPLAPQNHGSPSQCDPHRQIILAKLEQGLSARRIFQDLQSDYGIIVSYYSVRRFVGRLKQKRPLPFRRMECAPGQEVQIDFGTAAPILRPDGKRRRPHLFRIVLSHSRKAYSEVVLHQTTDAFIGCIENAFRHFGGVPKVLVIDNLRAAVSKADWYDPDINPKVQSFCEYYGVAILPTKPYTPRHKGKIERGVAYAQDNGLKGHTFGSLEEQNRHLLHWEQTVADTRIHGTTRQQVGNIFTEVERPALRPLPTERFPCFHEGKRSVHRDGHVEVDKGYYSVPPEYVGREIWARWDSRLVRLFNARMEQIDVHAKVEPGRFSTQYQHIAKEKRSAVERGTADMLLKCSRIGPQTAQWAESIIRSRGVEGVRVLIGLRSLAERYNYEQIEQACAIAVTHGALRLRTIRELIKRQGPEQEQFEFMQEHPIIRSLDDYGKIVQTSFAQEHYQ